MGVAEISENIAKSMPVRVFMIFTPLMLLMNIVLQFTHHDVMSKP